MLTEHYQTYQTYQPYLLHSNMAAAPKFFMIPSPMIYHPDGDLILAATLSDHNLDYSIITDPDPLLGLRYPDDDFLLVVLYRVHKTILEHNSPVFQDIIAKIPQDAMIYDGVIVVPTDDNYVHLGRLLQFIYDPSYVPSPSFTIQF